MKFTGKRIQNFNEDPVCLYRCMNRRVHDTKIREFHSQIQEGFSGLKIEECLKIIPQSAVSQRFLDIEAEKLQRIALS